MLNCVETLSVAASARLEEIENLYRSIVVSESIAHLHVTLGAYLANRLPVEPVWVHLVGPPSCGKSVTLDCLTDLPAVHPISTLTEAGLLSGSPSREHSVDTTGGLLSQIGEGGFGIILSKDFTSILSENRDTQKSLLAALREVYDGAWQRHLGTDGGKSFAWTGKVGFIGGTTPTIDDYQALRVAMGERYLLHRIRSVVSARRVADRALERNGDGLDIRKVLHRKVKEHLTAIELPCTIPSTSEELLDRLAILSVFVVNSRCVVSRDSRDRSISSVSEPEYPARLVKQLQTLLHGVSLAGCSMSTAWNVTLKTGLDSMPNGRALVLRSLGLNPSGSCITDISSSNNLVRKTTQRMLEDLDELGLTRHDGHAGSRGSKWYLTEEVQSMWDALHQPLATPPRAVVPLVAEISASENQQTSGPAPQTENSAPPPIDPPPDTPQVIEDLPDPEDDPEEEGTEHVSPMTIPPPAAVSEDVYLEYSDSAPGFEDDIPCRDIDEDVPEDSEGGIPAEKEMAYW